MSFDVTIQHDLKKLRRSLTALEVKAAPQATVILKRLGKLSRLVPPVRVQGYFNAMPEVIRTSVEIMQMEPEERRLGPPTAEAISKMEEVLDWIFYLEDEDERRLVWLRAERVYWKQICWRLGCGRTKAWQMWTYALLKITTRLNTRQSGL